jgi:hypothetical protein
LYNNQAAFYLIEAQLYEQENIDETKKLLELAREKIKNALKTRDINPGAYFSSAEIESYSSYVNLDPEISHEQREKIIAKICENLRLSIVNGFELKGTINGDNFFNIFKDFRYLENLGIPNYEEKILIAVNLNN